ncbi:MAG: DUF1697 domain-containing protein [Casimicrobium sp.]
MPRFVALLRGVNVGGNKRVPMDEWRVLLEGLGYTEVRTLLNSGNAVFASTIRSSATHETRIAASIAEAMQLDVAVVVKSAKEFAAIEAESPFAAAAADPSRLLVAFARDVSVLQGLAPLLALVRPPDDFRIGREAAYLWCPDGILQSKAGDALLGKLGKAVTTRNWATAQKISALLRE